MPARNRQVWTKRGLVFDVARHGVGGWMRHSALTPTPWLLDEERIRVYAGFRDGDGVSRLGYADLAADEPTRVLGVSKRPVLDIGRGGCFDDNGMILGDVVAAPGGLHLFYVGFQQVAKAKFLAFSGLALSTDGGERFQRVQETPILDRAPRRSTIAAIHNVSSASWAATNTARKWMMLTGSAPSYASTARAVPAPTKNAATASPSPIQR